MKRVHVIGGKNHGKTTLMVELVSELQSRGYCVGTIKHTHHEHELDVAGKDSHRHREAGAAISGILSRSMNAIFWPNAGSEADAFGIDPDSRYDAFVKMYSDCDVVLVEGDTRTSGLKLEVWRELHDTPPMAVSNAHITNVRAIITDDPLKSSIAVLRRTDVSSIADHIIHWIAELP